MIKLRKSSLELSKALIYTNQTHLKFVVCFFVLDPCFTLCLRIDQQWIPGSLGNNDTILNGQVVIG